jgi:hypothetical protein
VVLDSNSGSLSKIGFTFAGWNTQADGLGTTYAAGSSFTPTANITLYTKWLTLAQPATAPKFEITKIAKRQFNLEGGMQTVFGKNLNLVTYIALDGQVLQIITASDSTLTFAIAAGSAGWADLVMRGDGAVLTFKNFVQFVSPKTVVFTNFFTNGGSSISETQVATIALNILRSRDFRVVQIGFADAGQSSALGSKTITLKENMALVKLAMNLMKRLPKRVDVVIRLTGNTKDLTLTFNNN